MSESSINLILALCGGILPALVWLIFWLREDRLHPEPKSRIVVTFLAGMAAVFLVLPAERLVYDAMALQISIMTIVLWAIIEEVLKFASGLFGGITRRDNDEPIDAIIYMVTAALGFAAIENTMFIFKIIDSNLLSQSIITTNSRFVGATLLHVAASASIGVFLAIAHYKSIWRKIAYGAFGLILGTLLHIAFNILIIKNGNSKLLVFAGLWLMVILLFVLIEKIKTLKKEKNV